MCCADVYEVGATEAIASCVAISGGIMATVIHDLADNYSMSFTTVTERNMAIVENVDEGNERLDNWKSCRFAIRG